MDWGALGTATLALLKEWAPWLHDAVVAGLAMLTQRKLTEGKQAKVDLEAMQRADAAVRDVRKLDTAGKLSWLKQRGLLREDKPD